MKIVGIYKITSPTGRVYIGESKDIYKRWKKYKGLHCKQQYKLYNSFEKYKYENHIFEIIEECPFEELKCRERYYQDFYDVLNEGLNLRLTECGEKKQIISEDIKNKISLSNKGKVHSEETKQKWSEQRRGVGNGMYGKEHSEESKQKMSEARKGVNNPMYGKEGVNKGKHAELNYMFGRSHSEESKKKMSNAKKGVEKPKGKNSHNFKDRTGERWETKNNEWITITSYNSYKNCSIKFEDGTILNDITYRNIKKGNIKRCN